jgi:DNA modification methylase
VKKIEVVYLKPSDIQTNFGNPRKITKQQYAELKKSIETLGDFRNLVIDEYNNVIAGNQRLSVMKDLNIDTPILCKKLIGYTDAEKKAINIKDNMSSGEFDDVILAEWEEEIKIEIPDIELPEIENVKIKETKGDDDVNDTDKSISKIGDLWELNNHRILCGDSTIKENYGLLLNNSKASITFTSPPYNANTSFNGTKKHGNLYCKYKDNLKEDDYVAFTTTVLDNCFKYTDGFIFWNINYNSNSRGAFIKQIYPNINKLDETIVWKKTALPVPMGLTRIYEFIFVFSTKENGERIGHKNKTEYNFWEITNINSQNEKHIACFPVELPIKAIQLSGAVSILDPFIGSGSTLIASEKTDRICYGIELDEHYIDVIVKRWLKFMKDNNREIKSVKLNGKEYDYNEILND